MCPNEIRRSLLVVSSRSKWYSNIVYLSSFVLTANSGSSSPPRRAGPAKLVLATFRWTFWEWHVAIPRGFWIADSSSYLRFPPQNGNVSDGVMKVVIAIQFCAAVSLDRYSTSLYFLDFATITFINSVLSLVAFNYLLLAIGRARSR